jgi:hypothetical protein
MITSRWKKVWVDFWGNKSRTFLTVLTIMVGTFGVGFVSNFSLYLLESMDKDFLAANPSEAKINAYPMDDESVKIAREVPGVNAVEGRSITSAQVIQLNGQKTAIQFTAIKSPSNMLVDMLQPVKNQSSIAPLGYKEVLIDSNADSLGYKPGDLILVELGTGKQRELRLAGYLHAAAGYPYSQTRIVDAYVTPKTVEWLGGTLDYNMLAVSVAEKPTDQEHVTEVAQAVKERLERSGLVTITHIKSRKAYSLSWAFWDG